MSQTKQHLKTQTVSSDKISNENLKSLIRILATIPLKGIQTILTTSAPLVNSCSNDEIKLFIRDLIETIGERSNLSLKQKIEAFVSIINIESLKLGSKLFVGIRSSVLNALRDDKGSEIGPLIESIIIAKLSGLLQDLLILEVVRAYPIDFICKQLSNIKTCIETIFYGGALISDLSLIIIKRSDLTFDEKVKWFSTVGKIYSVKILKEVIDVVSREIMDDKTSPSDDPNLTPFLFKVMVQVFARENIQLRDKISLLVLINIDNSNPKSKVLLSAVRKLLKNYYEANPDEVSDLEYI